MIVERIGDMSPSARLRIIQQEDGDIIVAIIPGIEEGLDRTMADVEFCTVGMGGGHSPKTLSALRALAVAMAEDNACWHKEDAEFLGEEWLKWADERRMRNPQKGGAS